MACAVCGAREASIVLRIPFGDAPNGESAVVQCKQCGLRRLDPRPGSEIIGKYYAAAAGDGYNAYVGRKRSPLKQSIWNALRDGYAHPSKQPWWSRLLSPLTGPFASWAFDINAALDRREGLCALEVGAGYGDILIYLHERGCKTWGTDLSEAAVAKGREYGVDMRWGHLKDVALPTNTFDIAIMCHSLEHVPQPRVELAELSRLIKPGGKLHIAVPNGHAVRMDQDGLEWAHLSHPLHLWYFDAENLVRLLREYGFEPVKGPSTTTRHHALNAWRDQVSRRGPIAATRTLLAFLRESTRRKDGGDVLRVVAERRWKS